MMGPLELTVSSIAQDAGSEISESSRDEIRDMFGPDVYQERFRVDRSKLERMIQGDEASAEKFFQKIMENTNTYISWPHRLKVGAKSKKDPHVRIAGQPEDVQVARERVLDVLDAKTDRVNMKLDVSYTDHSHIIGKGGNTIKRVMETTGCHIHFPDSNRNSNTEKSNQVSIAGTLEGVEKARFSIRRLMPLIFSFELPVTGNFQPMPDTNSPGVQQVMKRYEVEVMFRQRFKLHSTLVLVKGCDWEAERVMQATKELIGFMCGQEHLSNVDVEMSLEISPQHHSVVLGRQSCNLKTIMGQTGTRILFPDAEDPNIPTIKKSNIRISGAIDKVYLARQHLIGSLPVIVMFELPSGMGCEDHENQVMDLMQKLEVSIKMRQKPRHSSLSVLIKGIERQAGNVYIACHKLLNLDGPVVQAQVPSSYFIPNLKPGVDSRDLHRGNRGGFGQLGGNCRSNSNQFPATSTCQQGPSTTWPTSSANTWTPTNVMPSWGSPGVPRPMPQQCMPLTQSMATVPRIIVPQGGFQPMYPSPDSAIHSMSASSMSSPNLSPRPSSSNSPTHGALEGAGIDIAAVLSEMSDRRAPGCEWKTLEKVVNHLSPPDYKRMQGYKAMQSKPNASQTRVPTSTWSGAGLSYTMPEYEMHRVRQYEQQQQQHEESSHWSPPSGHYPTYTSCGESDRFDSVPLHTMSMVRESSVPSDLNTLLVQHGLERYIELFTAHEIDIRTFLTLTETDLQHLGVDKFGPRRKMNTLISDMLVFPEEIWILFLQHVQGNG
ncbi:hypothetical protein B566_EDAN004897 [Ephemera danica]|nr:hypothetical protein B566_EDAN004897 [Ephemera danica]